MMMYPPFPNVEDPLTGTNVNYFPMAKQIWFSLPGASGREAGGMPCSEASLWWYFVGW